MTEKDFWDMEPRILISLLTEKKEIDKEKMKAQALLNACCIWGKNPDDIIQDGKKKEVPGIDKPVDPALLRGFYV